MVIENPWQPKPVEKPEKREDGFLERIAHPSDRLAAFLLDLFVVLSPCVLLFVSPLRRKLLEAVLLNNETQFLKVGVLISLFAVLIFWLYQTLSVGFWGTTLGKKFFAMKVVNVHTGRSPTLEQAALRGFVL